MSWKRGGGLFSVALGWVGEKSQCPNLVSDPVHVPCKDYGKVSTEKNIIWCDFMTLQFGFRDLYRQVGCKVKLVKRAVIEFNFKS